MSDQGTILIVDDTPANIAVLLETLEQHGFKVFMTALADTEDKVRGFEAGAVDYVTKPFQQDEVLARVRTHLTLERLRHQLTRANDQLEQRVAERTAEDRTTGRERDMPGSPLSRKRTASASNQRSQRRSESP